MIWRSPVSAEPQILLVIDKKERAQFRHTETIISMVIKKQREIKLQRDSINSCANTSDLSL